MVWYADAALYAWELFKLWISILFVVPFKEPQLLWLLIPVWLSGAFAEFFQEKIGTSMGNATSNATVVLWGSIDWTRQTVALMSEKVITGLSGIIFRFFWIFVVFVYGMMIIILGIKGHSLIKKIGRVREVTYVIVMFTPIFYGVMDLTVRHISATLLFFPLFYGTVELIDKLTPNPKAIVEDLEKQKKEKEPEFGSDLGMGPDFGDLGKGKGDFKF